MTATEPLDVLCVGSLVADHLCTTIPRLPQPGEMLYCDDMPLCVGGCAANVSLDLARLGVKVGIVGCVGEDLLGQFLVQTLQRQGVETSDVVKFRDDGTPVSLVLNVQGDDRRFIHALGVGPRLTTAMVPRERLQTAKVLYVGNYLMLPNLNPQGELTRLFREARRLGVKTVLDVVLKPGDLWGQLESLLAETDVFLPNEDEAAAITGLTDPWQQVARFRKAGAGTVVITRGERGTVLVNERMQLEAGTYPIEFVGATGAGDAFDAGFIAGMLRGEDEIGCLKWGSALGAKLRPLDRRHGKRL